MVLFFYFLLLSPLKIVNVCGYWPLPVHLFHVSYASYWYIESVDFSGLQLRVYLRTYALEQMVQAASSTAGLRTIKRVEQFLQELKVTYYPLYIR